MESVFKFAETAGTTAAIAIIAVLAIVWASRQFVMTLQKTQIAQAKESQRQTQELRKINRHIRIQNNLLKSNHIELIDKSDLSTEAIKELVLQGNSKLDNLQVLANNIQIIPNNKGDDK